MGQQSLFAQFVTPAPGTTNKTLLAVPADRSLYVDSVEANWAVTGALNDEDLIGFGIATSAAGAGLVTFFTYQLYQNATAVGSCVQPFKRPILVPAGKFLLASVTMFGTANIDILYAQAFGFTR